MRLSNRGPENGTIEEKALSGFGTIVVNVHRVQFISTRRMESSSSGLEETISPRQSSIPEKAKKGLLVHSIRFPCPLLSG